MESIGKTLIILGLFIVLMGVLLVFFEKLPFGLGRLPGDIYIKRDNFVFYFPLATSIIISIVLSLIFILISKISR
ncbi:Protein of unknown function [Persephonella hydrogeniphila]|uniref:DUF2905 domain-containing protein n=1 Tax=Persephonella hydrogeniphila TaxID=198703 RepID=A0A285NFY5_9AQUI|nr:DUF2905 domain-containing protein [Persephonella hydrogeniphila]SNZ08422.1 Protein of unknown function [Persephonella hydrogeniphila]